MMILVAGPYRSGTNDDPALIKQNVQEMESLRAAHLPGRAYPNSGGVAGAPAG